MSNDDNKHGFSGLSDLASDIKGLDDICNTEASSPPHKLSNPEIRTTATNKKESKGSDSIPILDRYWNFGWPFRSLRWKGWKWIIGIIAVIVVINLIENGWKNTKKSPYEPSSVAPRSYTNQSTRSTLAREIENGKTRANQMEIQIKDMDDRLEDYERRIRSYLASGMTDEYNTLAPSFNSLVSERNDLFEEYSRLIDKVNSKVKHYNSKYR